MRIFSWIFHMGNLRALSILLPACPYHGWMLGLSFVAGHPKTSPMTVLQPACLYTSACGPLITLLNQTHWESMGSAGFKGSTRSAIHQTTANHSPELLSLAKLQTPNSREVLLFTSPSPMPQKGCPRNIQDKAIFVSAFWERLSLFLIASLFKA